ncbi:MAG TPA: tRNA dimethylallyltransferase, partial [Candidatus Gracilibacteria bacterium]|nr:tRNA dimethylallyltransferase [Candidatus Gracilibacteria bacterium]
FIDFVTQNFDPPGVYPEWKKQFFEWDTEALWQRLLKQDPLVQGKIHPHNRVRVLRALEVIENEGHSILDRKKGENNYDILILMPSALSRSELYQKIDQRVCEMWDAGALEEVEKLLKLNLDPLLPIMTTIGVKEIQKYQTGLLSKAEAMAEMQKNTRNYAKRQLTWWRKDERVHFLGEEKYS